VITRPVLFAPWAVIAGREANDAALGQRTSIAQAGATDLTPCAFGINTEPFCVPVNPVRGGERASLGAPEGSRRGASPTNTPARAAGAADHRAA